MAIFQYEAMNAAGQEVKAEIDATTADEAIAKIRTQGYFPTKVKEKAAKKAKGGGAAAAATGSAPKKKGINIQIGGLSTKQITTFTRQLSTLQDAGLPILRSLKILWQQQKPGLLKDTLDAVAGDVEGGSTLSEAMSRHPKAQRRSELIQVTRGYSRWTPRGYDRGHGFRRSAITLVEYRTPTPLPQILRARGVTRAA